MWKHGCKSLFRLNQIEKTQKGVAIRDLFTDEHVLDIRSASCLADFANNKVVEYHLILSTNKGRSWKFCVGWLIRVQTMCWWVNKKVCSGRKTS